MEAQDTGKAGGGGRAAGTVLLGFLVLYFLCPFVFILPLVMIYGKATPPPPAVIKSINVFFWPVEQLAQRVPPYRKLLEKEGEWLDHH